MTNHLLLYANIFRYSFLLLVRLPATKQNLYRSLGGLSLGSSLLFLLDICFRIFKEFGNDTCGNSFASLSKGEALSLQDRQRVVQLHGDGKVVTWHAHGGSLWQFDIHGAVSSSNEALWAVAGEEGLGAATFVWLEHVNLSLTITTHRHTVGLGDAHAALDLLSGDATEEHTDVVTSLGSVQLLVESFNSCNGRHFVLTIDSNHVHFIVDLGLALLDGSRCDDSSAGDAD